MRTHACSLETMSLLDDTIVPKSESSIEAMTTAHDTHPGASAVIDAPEHAQPSSADVQASAPEASHDDVAETQGAGEPASSDQAPQEHVSQDHVSQDHAAKSEAPESSASESAGAASDDFAAALHSFETETEEAVGEDHVIKGRVVKLTATHVVVDIGAKSEGMVPIAEALDHEGKPKFAPGDEIDVMRDKGETEEGYVNLSHLKAARLRSWDEIERATQA